MASKSKPPSPPEKASIWLDIVAWFWVVVAGIFSLMALGDGMIATAVLLWLSVIVALPLFRGGFRWLGASDSFRRGVGALAAIASVIAIGIEAPAPAGADPVLAPQSAKTAKAEFSLTARAEMERVGRDVLQIAKPCDDANTGIATALQNASEGRLDMYELYGQARDAQRICSNTSQEMAKIQAPSALPAAQSKMVSEALDRCELGYYSRKESLETLMGFIDGDQRPSILATYKEQAEASQAGVMLCVAGISMASTEMRAKFPS